AFHAQKNLLVVAALGNNTVEVLDLAAGKRIQRLEKIHEPQGVCVLPKSGRLVVASGGDGNCRLFDEGMKLVGGIEALADADNVRFDAEAERLYVGYGAGALAVIDPGKPAKLGEIALLAHPESFQIETKGSRIFVNVPRLGHVAVADRKKGVVIATWPIVE